MNMEKGMTQEEKEEWKKVMKIENDKPLIQVRRTTGTNLLHLQVFGENASELSNRPYGYADKFSVPPVVTASVANQENLYPSFASAQEIYIRDIATVHGYADGVQLHITVPSDDWNAPHGFVLDLPAQRFSAFIAFVEAVGLLTNHEGEQRFVEQPQEEE
tara:strand:+ start:1816 stop:2295 length:480 start_codon:yes stop_codon:yes gene_type:complete